MDISSEHNRLHTLRACEILDTAPEAEFDELVQLAAAVCGAPISIMTLVDAERQWVKAAVGTDITETPREIAFCDHLVRNNRALLVEDAQTDTRFRDNPLVAGAPGIRFYAGIPFHAGNGLPLGGLCVIDLKPRQLSEQQEKALTVLAKQVSARLELMLQKKAIDEAMAQLRCYQAELEDANARLRQLSLGDALTGLANRRAFEERLSTEFARSRLTDATLAVLMIDVDNFKQVNDRFGHGYGDEVLQKVAICIARSTRMLDLAVRYGGEEFAVLMPATHIGGAVSVAERIQRELKMEHWEHQPITVSIGVGTTHETTYDTTALVGSADVALYKAKAAGKDRVVVNRQAANIEECVWVDSTRCDEISR